jgi:Rha family phage regulatory protein
MVGSDDVARKFGKVHRDVMRAIGNIECSNDFKARNFAQSKYCVRGKDYNSVSMTRDGFTFLCMGFTGKEAAKWKEAYINAFNQMEYGLNVFDTKINTLTLEGRNLKEAGKDWSEFGHEIRKQKKQHTESVLKLMSEVQFKLEI